MLAANTQHVNHYWPTDKWSEAELNRSGYTHVKPTKIPDALIDERGLGPLKGAEVGAWAAVRAQTDGQGGEQELPQESTEITRGVRLQGGAQDTTGEGRAEGGGMGGERRQSVAGSTAHPTAIGRHAIRTRGAVTWCDVCGAYGVERAGTRLMGACQPQHTRHMVTRLERLRKGLRPISGKEWAPKQ